MQAASGDLPHMLFYGPSGAGKKTRITATLRAIFGPGAEKVRYISHSCDLQQSNSGFLQLKIDQRVFMTPSRRKLDVNIVQSNFHIELTPRCASWHGKPETEAISNMNCVATLATTTA